MNVTVSKFKERFEELYRFSKQLEQGSSLPWLAAFKYVFHEHANCTFAMWEGDEGLINSYGVRSNTGLDIETDGDPRIRFEQHLLDKFNHVVDDLGLAKQEVDDLVDNFLIHELLHRAQGFKDGGHRLVPTVSPPGLLRIDFEADSYAVLVQISRLLTLDSSQGITLRGIYQRCIKSVIHQTHVFKYYRHNKPYISHKELIDKKSIDKAIKNTGTKGFDGSYIARWAAWHFQYFRCELFNQHAPLDLIQLNVMPIVNLKGVYAGRRVHDGSWHDADEESVHENKSVAYKSEHSNVLVICVNNYRFSQRSRPQSVPYEAFNALVTGIVTGELAKTKEGIKFILTNNENFIGKPYNPNGGGPPPDDGFSVGYASLDSAANEEPATFSMSLERLNEITDGDRSRILDLVFNGVVGSNFFRSLSNHGIIVESNEELDEFETLMDGLELSQAKEDEFDLGRRIVRDGEGEGQLTAEE